jgi:hypothetical protein
MQSWLRQRPEVTVFVILDDDDNCKMNCRLFQPTSKIGLTDETATASKNIGGTTGFPPVCSE